MEDTAPKNNKYIIPNLPWKYFDELMLAIGTGEFTIKNHNNEKIFLESIGFVSTVNEAVSLTPRGKEYYIQKFVNNSEIEAKKVLCEALKLHPAVILISQILSGSKNIKRINIYNLLKHHCFNLDFQKEVELNNFLEILKLGDIASYNKNTRDVKVLWQQETESLSSHQFISPETPFSNIKRLKDIIKSLKGTVYWIDKHFDKKAFDILVDSLDAAKITHFIIISGDTNKTLSAVGEFLRLKTELHNRGINIEWEIITDLTILSSFHDRWICDSNVAWNIPPVNSIFKGQESEMLRTSNKPNIHKLLKNTMSVK